MAANHRKTLKLNASMEQVLSVVRSRAFASALRIELKSENPESAHIWFRFHHGTSFTSWGEKITITLTPVTAYVTDVDVFSECGMPTQVIDWGKNKQNVCNILEYMEANLPAATAAPSQRESGQEAPTADASAKKFCFHCGKQLPEDAAFCSHCGTKQA